MSQTNVQVPIQQRNHDKEVLEKRPILEGDARTRSEGPASLAQDDKGSAVVLYHVNLNGGATPGLEAPDMLYREHTTDAGETVAGMPGMGRHKQHMSGRRHSDQATDLNQGRNVGSTHLQMPAEPHHKQHVKEMPPEGGVTLPKDQ